MTSEPSFEIVLHEGRAGIRCLRCGRTSWNANDVAQQYCGFCHSFHEKPER